MITRGGIIVEKERKDVFPIILESCNELNIKPTEINEKSFYISGKSPTFRYKLDLKIGAKLEIFLRPNESETLIEIYDHLPTGPDKRFIEKFFKTIGKRIPLPSQYSYEAVKKEDIPKPFEENVKTFDDLNTQNDSRKLMIYPSLIKKYEYSLEANVSSETNKLNANKIIVYPIENESKIEFLNGTNIESYLPFAWIEKIVTETQTKGAFNNQNDMYIKVFFSDPNGNKGSIKINLQEKHILEALNILQSSLAAEKENYWNPIEISFRDATGSLKNTSIYPKTPFLTKDEQVLWLNHIPDGIINKKAGHLQAITNFRIIEYNFLNHKCNYILLSSLDDVIIMNRNTTAQTTRVGNYIEAGNLVTGIGNSTSNLRTRGDLVFIYEGKPFIKFIQIFEPDGLDKLVISAKKQLVSLNSNSQKLQLGNDNISDSKICIKCNSSNSHSSKFCNNCGMKLINECSKCNTINPPNSNFCNNCGISLQ